MLVVVMNNGFIGQKILNLSRPYLQNELNVYAETLNQNLKNSTVGSNKQSININHVITELVVID